MTIYTSGIWIVKPGKETEFIQAWQAFAEWTTKNQAEARGAQLLQDIEKPGRFISFGPWKDIGSIGAWRATPEFAEFFARAKLLCDDIQPGTFNVAAYAGS